MLFPGFLNLNEFWEKSFVSELHHAFQSSEAKGPETYVEDLKALLSKSPTRSRPSAASQDHEDNIIKNPNLY